MINLPIQINASIMSECWTYYKLSIIETSPNYQEWLASHLDVFIYDDLKVFFGNVPSVHTIDYYNEILDFKQMDLWNAEPKFIIEKIIDELNKGYYVVLYSNFPKLFKKDCTDVQIHETLLFGFDKNKKVFYSTSLQSGKFKETEIAFFNLTMAYKDAYEYFKNYPQTIIDHEPCFYTITTIKIKDTYSGNDFINGMLNKLSKETHGRKIVISFFDEKKQQLAPYTYYAGLACLLGLEEGLRTRIENNTDIKSIMGIITNSLLKLYEHRKIILSTMMWFEKKHDTADSQLIELIDLYEKCCNEMEKLYLISYKCQLSFDNIIIKEIIEKLSNQYLSEKEILLKYEKFIKAWNLDNKSYKGETETV